MSEMDSSLELGSVKSRSSALLYADHSDLADLHGGANRMKQTSRQQ